MHPAKRPLSPCGSGPRVAWLALVLSVLLTAFAPAASAAVPRVDDQAGLFSEKAEAEANQTLERIYRNTSPHKQVFIETKASLASGEQADQLAAERFRAQRADGVLLLIVKDPHKLALTIGRATDDRFHDAETVRSAMLERFRQNDYDGGLLAGLSRLEARLTALFPTGPSARDPESFGGGYTGGTERAGSERAGSERSGRSWLWLLLLGGGGVLAFLLWRSRKRGTGSAVQYGPPVGEYGPGTGPGYAAPGTPYAAGAGGGGWARPIIGGAAGALAGNWLYDKLFHGDRDGSAHAATHGDSGRDVPDSDAGDVGSTLGGGGDGDDWSSGDIGGGGDDW